MFLSLSGAPGHSKRRSAFAGPYCIVPAVCYARITGAAKKPWVLKCLQACGECVSARSGPAFRIVAPRGPKVGISESGPDCVAEVSHPLRSARRKESDHVPVEGYSGAADGRAPVVGSRAAGAAVGPGGCPMGLQPHPPSPAAVNSDYAQDGSGATSHPSDRIRGG